MREPVVFTFGFFLWGDGYIRMRCAENGTVGGGFYIIIGGWEGDIENKDLKYCEQAIEED